MKEFEVVCEEPNCTSRTTIKTKDIAVCIQIVINSEASKGVDIITITEQ